jgi:spore maturation protein CgeB
MSCGTFCLTRYFPGIERIFKKEIHLDWWKDFDELITLADYYLAKDEERKSIANSGSDYVRAHHRWKDRVEKILDVVKKVPTFTT